MNGVDALSSPATRRGEGRRRRGSDGARPCACAKKGRAGGRADGSCGRAHLKVALKAPNRDARGDVPKVHQALAAARREARIVVRASAATPGRRAHRMPPAWSDVCGRVRTAALPLPTYTAMAAISRPWPPYVLTSRPRCGFHSRTILSLPPLRQYSPSPGGAVRARAQAADARAVSTNALAAGARGSNACIYRPRCCAHVAAPRLFSSTACTGRKPSSAADKVCLARTKRTAHCTQRLTSPLCLTEPPLPAAPPFLPSPSAGTGARAAYG